MTWRGLEDSVCAAQPVELYRFVLNTERWLYCAGTDPVIYNTELYEPLAMSGGEVSQGDDALISEELEVDLPRDTPLAALCLPFAPEGVVNLTVYRGHYGDDEFITVWVGRVAAVTFTDDQRARFSCEPIMADFAQMGLRLRDQRTCPHRLYSSGLGQCNVPAGDYLAEGVASSVEGAVVQADIFGAEADGWWTAGLMAAGEARRWIIGHSGNSVTLAAPIPGLAAGAVIYAWAGCDKLLATCRDKFSNLANYGGRPWLPARNPFAGDKIM